MLVWARYVVSAIVIAVVPLVLLDLVLHSRARAEETRPLRGVALVIGQSKYQHLSPLPNPTNDANAIGNLLSDLGFATTLVSDRDARQLRRALDGFVADADDADVAILYYAGHGIEAGGENYLVPVDADLTALDAAGERMVPISAYLQHLKASVPVTILMLDACRDNPFPPAAQVRVAAGADPVPMGEAGLGETRGATRLAAAPAAAEETYGTVIAFAAEPGRAALDGEPGANSPYTAAVLRHLDAMAGEEFGTVMRMVAEEVYLKTGGRQQPWVNESLRRLLYFGSRPDPVEGPEGDILRERRNLLLTISNLPSAERQQIEAVAREGAVPIDTIYAVLTALGQDAPSDPRELDRVLREQVERLTKLQAERAAISSTDEELTRLLALSETALQEGALRTAIDLNQRAKDRVKALSGTVEAIEDQLRERRVEFAAVYARSAEAYEIAGEYENAAADYEAAYEYVIDHDSALASSYRLGQSWSVKNIGHEASDMATLEWAVELAREGAELAWDVPEDYAWAMRFVGENLHLLGWHTERPDLIEEAIDAYEQALEIETREDYPDIWAQSQTSIANSLEYLSWLEEDDDKSRAYLEEALDRYFEVMEVHTREEMPLEWAATASHAAKALYQLANIDFSMEMAIEAIEMAQGAALVIDRDENPDDWAAVQESIGGAYRIAGHLLADTDLDAAANSYRKSIEHVRLSISMDTLVPADVANALNNMGDTYLDLWDVTQDEAALDGAQASFQEALDAVDGLEAELLRAASEAGLDAVREAR